MTESFDYLVLDLASDDILVQKAAAEALGRLADSRALTPLIATLHNQNQWVREASARALGKLGNPDAVEALLMAVKDTNLWVCKAAITSLGQLNNPQAIMPLVLLLGHKDASVQRAAIHALVNLSPSSFEALLAALDNPERLIRKGAVTALGKLGDERAVMPLIQVLHHNDMTVRQKAILALKNIGGTTALAALTEALQDSNALIRRAVLQAINELDWQEAEDGPLILVAEDESDERELFVSVLKLWGYRSIEAYHGEMAIRQAQRYHPDLILLDVRMPRLNGFDAFKRLKKLPETAAIPVIFLSADSQAQALATSKMLGAAAYMIKPYTPAEVIERIRAVLNNYKRLAG